MKRLLYIILAAFGFADGSPAQTPADVPPGLVHWWRGENDTQDSIGTAHGTVAGELAYAAGTVGNAFDFTGSQSVLCPGEFILHRRGDATIMFWLKSSFSGNESLFWTRPDNNDTNRFNVALLAQAGGTLALDYRAPNGALPFVMSTTVSPNVWVHIAIVRAGNTYTIFKNGAAAAQATDPSGTALLPNPSSWQISGRSGYQFTGELDELASFSRALSASEIGAVHAAGPSGNDTSKPYFTLLDALPNGAVGTPYFVPFAAAITPGPHTFTLDGGTLPPGLDLHADGLLHGTPTAAATASFSITATSSIGQTNTQTFSLEVAACLDPAPTDMVAWWRGQDDALDAAGTNHGTLLNGATYSAGKTGRGFILDGSDDRMSASGAGLPLNNAARSVEFWMNSTDSRAVAPCFYGNPEPGNAFYPVMIGGRIGLGWWGGGDVMGTKTVNDGQWHHVAIAYDGAGTINVYVDGVVDATAGGRNFSTTATTFYIGGPTGHAFYAGRLDEVTVYDRALTAAEAGAIYNAGAGGKCGALHLTTLSPLPNAGQGVAFSQTLAVTGGTAPFDFALLDGALPAGLALSSAGELSGTPAGSGLSEFTVRVTDAQTRPADRHYFLRVNARPVFSVIPPQIVDELTQLTVNNTAIDADAGDMLAYELVDPPPGAAIDAAGTITWTPTETQGTGTFTITTRATDNGTPSLSAENSFTVTVNEVNVAPTLPAQANPTMDELTVLTVANPGSDPDHPANNLTYTLTEAPAGAVIDAAGVITWTPSEAQGPGVFTFTTRVDDNGAPNLGATNTFTVTVQEVNTAPALPAAADRTVDELTLLTVNDTAADGDLPDNGLNYQLLTAPAGAAISASGVITWTPAENQGPGTHSFSVRVTDNGTPPLSDTHNFTVTVNEVNTAPTLPPQADRTVDELTPLTVNNPATDAELPVNGLTYELIAPPPGASI